MTTKPVKPALDIAESAVKLALDNAELIELVPELQREATAVNFNDSGGLVLIPPRHPAVTAFTQELEQVEYKPVPDLKTAQRRLRVAHDAYQSRVANRVTPNLTGPTFNRYVSLSAILMARAAGRHWHKIVLGFQIAAKLKRHHERDKERAARFCLIGDKLYPKGRGS